MGIFNEFFKKEKPVFTGIARGLVVLVSVPGAGGASASAPGGASASGGIHEYLDPTPGTKYRCHFSLMINFCSN